MNDYDVQIRLLEGAARVAGLGLNWLVQSSLLLSVGLLVGWLLRRCGPAAQSVVYRTALVAVLVCPVATWTLARTGVRGGSVDLPPAWTLGGGPGASDGAGERPGGGMPAVGGWVFAFRERPLDVAADDARGVNVGSAAAPGPLAGGAAISRKTPVSATVLPIEQPDVERTSAPTGRARGAPRLVVHGFGLIASLVCLIWLLSTTVLLARLAGAWRQLARVCKSAVEADPATVATCREVAALLRVAPPDVKHTPYVPSPCLAGLRRPVILLPEGALDVMRREVLIHELAHLARHDGHWILLRRLATAVFFFQPLLWKLGRRLEMTAEEVCDDYVVQYGSDRQAYAHRLADIAELSFGSSVSWAAVGVVSLRSLLARRVARILDTSRSLSTQVGTRLLALVLFGGLVGTAGVGLLGVGERPFAAEAGITSEDRPEPNRATVENAIPPGAEICGRVFGSDGKPVAGAHVAAIGMKLDASRGGDLSPRSAVLAEATTDEQGNYQLRLLGVSSKTHHYANVIARADGVGLAWQRLDPDARQLNASFELPGEQMIRGRLIDNQGQPAADVRMSIVWVGTTSKNERPAEGVGFRDFKDPPAAWPRPVTTDEQGRFVIRNVAADHGVYLQVEGTDRFALQTLALNTAMAEERGERDATYRPQVGNFKPGEEAVLSLAPARIFEGVVRYEDTGEPAPHARLTVWASQQEFGSMLSIAGTADEQGRYRLHPYSGIQFGVTAYPPGGAAYLIRQVQPIAWTESTTLKQVDVTLPRGVLVRGTVVEAGTSTAVAGAMIQYVPEVANNPHAAEDILTGWQGIQLSGEHGRFEIPVLPGPGRLVVHGPAGDFVFREIGSGQLEHGRPGGRRSYAHAFLYVNPEPQSEPIDVTIELQRGLKIAVRLTQENGQPVDRALVITRLNIRPGSLDWRGDPMEAFGGRFELSGLAAGREYPMHFLDPQRRLGATAMVKASDEVLNVVLAPCGQATAKFTDSEGQPLAGIAPILEMVVTPGLHGYDRDAMQRGELAADADFTSNIDRTNYWLSPKTDAEGHITFPALIPGGTYRLLTAREGKTIAAKEFTVKSRETTELGEIVFQDDK